MREGKVGKVVITEKEKVRKNINKISNIHNAHKNKNEHKIKIH